MSVQERLYSADELLLIPDDGRRRELVAGRLIEMVPPGDEHGILAAWVAHLLWSHEPARQSGYVRVESGFLLSRDPDTVRSPDVSFARREPVQSGFVPHAPDFAVEIVSPGDSASEIEVKVGEYFQAGVRLVWVLYPASRTIYAYQSASAVIILRGDDVLAGDPVLPEFTVRVREVFAVLDSPAK